MTTPEARKARLLLPPGTKLTTRLSLWLIEFLVHHREADSLMCFIALWWGALTLIWPDFWHAWPPTVALYIATQGHPEVLSLSLLFSGALGYVGSRRHWTWGRRLSSLVRFICWSIMVVVFMSTHPIATPGVACYSAFALSELMSYVNHVVGTDEYAPPLNYRRRSDDDA